MSNYVQQFLLKAHPMETHPKYFSWVIADLCIFIGEDDTDLVIKIANDIIKKEKWIPLTEMSKSTLIEDKIIETGGDVLEAYNQAKNGNYYFQAFTNTWIGFKDSPPMSVPRLTENFIDKVMINAGGKRIKINESSLTPKNADYLIDNYIFELKIIEEERLYKDTVKNKISKLLFSENEKNIEITHDYLDEQNVKMYMNIFRTPIQNAIKSASKQIKSTRQLLNNNDLFGGLLIINNGITSITPDVFNLCIKKSIENDTKQIRSYISISNWIETDGFNSNYQIMIKPEYNRNKVQERIIESFDCLLHNFMTDWARAGFSQNRNLLEPLKNISFEKYGIIFTKFGNNNY